MKIYLIIEGGGDIFEEHWECPIEIVSTEEFARKRCEELNEESVRKRTNHGFRYSAFELDKTYEHF